MRRALIVSALASITACVSSPVLPASESSPLAPLMAVPGVPACMPDMELLTRDEAALLALIPCLEHPDPAIRDSYAFSALSAELRGGTHSTKTLRRLHVILTDMLARGHPDPDGFRGPFAALALAELARTDRIAPWMTEEQRSGLISLAGMYLARLQDYRGYSETEGWRHGVAHTADLLMQLSLNPELTKPQAEAILAAIALKVGTTQHAYIFGESERLAAPVTYLAFKETFTTEEWSAWFAGLWPPEDTLREDAYTSEAALRKLHNLRAFTQSVYINAVASNDDRMKPVAGAAFEFLNQLP